MTETKRERNRRSVREAAYIVLGTTVIVPIFYALAVLILAL